MQNIGCAHASNLVYSRKTFIDGQVHYCMQCTKCGQAIKSKHHDYKLWLKHSDVPPHSIIYPFDEVAHNAKQ